MVDVLLRGDWEAVLRQEGAKQVGVVGGDVRGVDVQNIVNDSENAKSVLRASNVVYALHYDFKYVRG